jgi:hypothetical protein
VEDLTAMINSKAIKDSSNITKYSCGCEVDKKKRSKLRNLLHQCVHKFFMFTIFYPVESFFSRTKERISRSYRWARFMWLNYDFDSAYIYSVMSFKMKSLYDVLENGHAVQEPEDMAALKEATAICDRLFEGNYEDKYLTEHDKKWGKLRTRFVPQKDGKGSLMKSSRKGVKNKRQSNQERKEFMKCWENGEHDRKSDIDRLAEIFKNYSPKWWD